MSSNQQQNTPQNSQTQSQIPQQNPNQPTIDQVITQMRSAQSQAHSDTQYLSLSNFDKLVDQLRIFSAQINDRNIEISRLQELCIKSNVDITPPAPSPVKLPENEAVILPAQKETPVVATPNVENN